MGKSQNREESRPSPGEIDEVYVVGEDGQQRDGNAHALRLQGEFSFINVLCGGYHARISIRQKVNHNFQNLQSTLGLYLHRHVEIKREPIWQKSSGRGTHAVNSMHHQAECVRRGEDIVVSATAR